MQNFTFYTLHFSRKNALHFSWNIRNLQSKFRNIELFICLPMLHISLTAQVATPLGVHIGYQMALSNWIYAVVETIILMIIHMIAPLIWIKAQTEDIKK